METALAIARKHDGELVAVSVAEVPEGESLLAGRRLVRELEPVLEQAVEYAPRARRDRAAGGQDRAPHQPGAARRRPARRSATSWSSGSPHTQSFFERIVSTIVERVLQDAPCQVGVVYGNIRPGSDPGDRRAGDREARTRSSRPTLAPAFATAFSVAVRALTIVERGVTASEAKRREAAARETLETAGFEHELEVLRHRDVSRAITGAIRHAELVLIGAPSVGPVVPIFGDTIPALLAKRGQNPVVVVRDVEATRSAGSSGSSSEGGEGSMQAQVPGPLTELVQRIANYLPTLAAGLFVLALGVVVGWLAKRAVVRVLIWLRLDRLGGRASWRAAFGKGDVRAALYNLTGTLDDGAWSSWCSWTTRSRSGASRCSLAWSTASSCPFPTWRRQSLVVGVGLLLVNVLAHRVEDLLEDERAPRPRLVAGLVRAALLAFVGALALWELDFARQIVLAGFLITFGAIGIAFSIAVGLGSAKAIQRGWETLLEKRKDE